MAPLPGLLFQRDVELAAYLGNGPQVLGILVTVAFVAVADLVIALIVKALFKGNLRVSAQEEAMGLDVSAHGESAYPAYLGLD